MTVPATPVTTANASTRSMAMSAPVSQGTQVRTEPHTLGTCSCWCLTKPGQGCNKEGGCCHPACGRFYTLQRSCLFRRMTPAQSEIKGVSGAANSTPAAPTPMGIRLLPCPTGLFDGCWKWWRALMGAAPTPPCLHSPLSSGPPGAEIKPGFVGRGR